MTYLLLALVAAGVIVLGACALLLIGIQKTEEEQDRDDNDQADYLRRYAQSARARLKDHL